MDVAYRPAPATGGAGRQAGVFAIVLLASGLLHEFGHWIGFSLVGIPAAISFDHTYFTVRWEPSLAGAAGGPIATIAFAWIGVLLLFRRRSRFETLGRALAVVMPLTRFVTYAFCAAVPRAMSVNDEGVMSLDCGWSTWTWVWILLPFLLGPWVMVWIQSTASPMRKLGLFGGAAIAWVGLMVFEVTILEPRLFPEAAKRELVMPHAPQAVGALAPLR
jgi:hypothetical protein